MSEEITVRLLSECVETVWEYLYSSEEQKDSIQFIPKMSMIIQSREWIIQPILFDVKKANNWI